MTSVRSRLAALVTVALVAAAGLVGLSSGPAAAALCSGSGVNVVVDFNDLGGGVQKGCDPGGAGRSGDKVFPAAGFGLTYAQREPGFVCRVRNAPQSAQCVNASPTNAYWGLYWSDGKSGKWTYSSSGVGGTSVPNGGFLAFSWQNGGSADPPGAAPVNSTPAPATKGPSKTATKTATKTPTKESTKQPDPGSGSTSVDSVPGATPDQPTKTQGAADASLQQKKTAKAKGAQASKQAKAKAKSKASASASARSSASASAAVGPSDEASPDVTSAEPVDSAFASEEEQNGLPGWVPVLVVLALAGAAGGTAWWRRRTGAP
jgi:hypothetical protein